MAEYSLHRCGRSWHTVHAANEMLQTFELVTAKDGIDTGLRQCRSCLSVDQGLGPVAPISVNFNHQLAYFADHSDTTHVRHQPTAVA